MSSYRPEDSHEHSLLQAAGVEHRASFFRQSGWMMITSIGTGVLMFLVHIFSKFVPDNEYAAFATLLQFLNWITIPAIGLQVTFAHQTSAVTTLAGKRQLVGTIRAVFLGTFAIWVAVVIGCFVFQPQLLRSMNIAHPAALWITVLLGLVLLWLPILQGLLQGRQNFLWLGWAAVFNGAGRVVLAGFVVLVLLQYSAAGIMTGALLGGIAALTVGFWLNRDLLAAEGERFRGREWLRTVVPLSLGCGAGQFMFSADPIAVQAYLAASHNTAPYLFGGTLARALVLFTAPLVSVMFPKLVHSAARNKKTDLMLLTLGLTVALVFIGVVGISLGAPLAIKLGSKKEYLSFVPLMPLFALSMAPLAIANVLLNNLMAHSRFRCVPVLVLVAAGYWIALRYFHDSFRTVIQVLGLANTVFLAVCAWFTWRERA